ncbi:hypothetical protein [Tannerella forsythia]|uniref:Uncharacterized protein n=1 Tax=Tannerella forsythia TaxID=28112 RepID=A0A3P1XMS9_TANFO|nr:hypothetical protein [Tannerella forsythia]RRD60079.1 hypothetical protein EII40_08080 [Tannerella forsythia]
MKKMIYPLMLIVVGVAVLLFSLLCSGSTTEELKIRLSPANYIMPAAYKVYSTPEVLGGRMYLFRAVLQNKGKRSIENLKVEYRIPKYIDTWTLVEAPSILIPGQTTVCMAYPAFDKSITEKNSQSRERVDIRITYGSKDRPQEIDEGFMFTMLSVNDFAYTDMPRSELVSYSDMFDNISLSACFITAEDPIVQYYTSKVKQTLLQGEVAGVNPTPEEYARFLKGIYEATLRSGMVYSSTSGMPANLGSVATLIQRIRLPREVIIGNTGLCIELTFLYAAILRNAGMESILFSVPGHIYPGFRLNNQYYAIEATGIGGAGLGKIASADEAFQQGMTQLSAFFEAQAAGDERYKLIDVNALISSGIIPMELKDDTYMRQKIDELSSLWGQGGGMMPMRGDNTGMGSGTFSDMTSSVENNGASFGTKTFRNGVTFSYPAGWNVVYQPDPYLPVLTASVVDPKQDMAVEVYNIQGTADIGTAIDYLVQSYQSRGIQISYQLSGNRNGFVMIAGKSMREQGAFGWKGAFRTRDNAVVGICVPDAMRNAQQVLASLR